MNANVECVLYNLEQLESDKKPLAAKDQLRERLTELMEGKSVPLVVFSCLDFTWQQQRENEYPKGIVSFNAETSICRYYQDYIGVIALELADLGNPDLKVIVPDSELLDERVFSFTQSIQIRQDLVVAAKVALAAELVALNNPDSPVVLWSEYCRQQNLQSPLNYTGENYQRIKADSKLQKKVKEQVRDSKQYFEKDGINVLRVPDEEFVDRITWYLAMYMGEGQALGESKAICLNFEDRRVPTWFQRGARGNLPILTPVDLNDFYKWRKGVKIEI